MPPRTVLTGWKEPFRRTGAGPESALSPDARLQMTPSHPMERRVKSIDSRCSSKSAAEER